MKRAYIFLLILLSIILTGCNKDNESNKVDSILLGTWVEGPDSPYYTIEERFVYVFYENGECTEYVINEKYGRVNRYELYYKLNTKNMVLTLSDKKSGNTFFRIIKFSDNNTTLILYDGFFEGDGYNENNLPIDDEYFKDIDFIFHKGVYPIN